MRALSFTARSRSISLKAPFAFGIVNLNADSFHTESRCQNLAEALELGRKLLQEGAWGLDLGGESTRPGSERLGWQMEMERIGEALPAFRQAFPMVLLSLDTRHAACAEKALEAGFDIINDVSSLRDPKMAETVAKYGAGLVLTHAPENLANGENEDVTAEEVADFLEERSRVAEKAGLPKSCIIWDPGLGFGKSAQCNWNLLAGISILVDRGRPVMCSASRKRFTRPMPNGKEGPLNSGKEGTIKAHRLALQGGAQICRVHHVEDFALAFAEREKEAANA